MRCYRCIDRWMYDQYQRVASVSPAATANLVAWLPKVRGKVTECPNGINVDAFMSASTSGKRALFSVSESTPVILCVGSLGPAKGHDTLLRAVSLVPDVILALVGEGRLLGQLHDLADMLGVASRVQFLGNRMDVPQLLKAADIYVQPSHWESFSLAALEAMAAGKPVVASNAPGLAQVVGDAGLLSPVGDVRRLAQCIISVLGDPAMSARLGRAAEQRARSFDLDGTLDCYEQLYKNIAGKVAG